MNAQVTLVVLIITNSRVILKFRGHSPISFKHMSSSYPLLDPTNHTSLKSKFRLDKKKVNKTNTPLSFSTMEDFTNTP